MVWCLKELDVSVEKVPLGDVDALDAQLVHQAQDARCDDRLPHNFHTAQSLKCRCLSMSFRFSPLHPSCFSAETNQPQPKAVGVCG